MKIVIAMLLVVIMVFSMAACGKNPKTPANTTENYPDLFEITI